MNCPASFGVAIRPKGISLQRASLSSVERHEFISVSTAPKATALICMLLGASSFASAFVKLLIAPFVAE